MSMDLVYGEVASYCNKSVHVFQLCACNSFGLRFLVENFSEIVTGSSGLWDLAMDMSCPSDENSTLTLHI
jgi:hypothetical protein